MNESQVTKRNNLFTELDTISRKLDLHPRDLQCLRQRKAAIEALLDLGCCIADIAIAADISEASVNQYAIRYRRPNPN